MSWVELSLSRFVGEGIAVNYMDDGPQLWEAGSWDGGQFGSPEEAERPPLEAAIAQGLVNMWLWSLACECNSEI
jgi:hypothetical protein